jgi:hypothetical protein
VTVSGSPSNSWNTTQQRIGGNHPPETMGTFVAAKFEHDMARSVDGPVPNDRLRAGMQASSSQKTKKRKGLNGALTPLVAGWMTILLSGAENSRSRSISIVSRGRRDASAGCANRCDSRPGPSTTQSQEPPQAGSGVRRCGWMSPRSIHEESGAETALERCRSGASSYPIPSS